MNRFIANILFFLILFLFLSPLKTFASEYFTTSYYVTYEVGETGDAQATIDVTLTNKTSDYYASSYKVQVGFKDITNVLAKDASGDLSPVVTKIPDGNIIEAEFNEKVVGKDNSLTYTISFTTSDIAHLNGSIWEINIPGISDPSAFDAFTVDVKVPESFGNAIYIKPYQGSQETRFTKDQLGTSGISIAYGSEQIYAFDLTYHLQNTNVFAVQTEIALPPSTNYQDVYISSIEPTPDNVALDQDGNWLATYSLPPTTKQDILVKGHAIVRLIPKKEELSEEELEAYLVQDDYWEVSDPQIQKLAKELQTPRAIYQYLVTNLSYDFSRVEENKPRLGGVSTLENSSSAVCLEFTDLFITLARAAGIPAREVDGYAHTENDRQRPLSLVQDILHAWPEYYDAEKQTWIMVDPTWGNTTGGVDYFDVFDFDHFAFVIKGADSEYPVPAGGYKYDGEETVKDLSISFDPTFKKPDSNLSFYVDTSETYFSQLPLEATLVVQNKGQGLTPQNDISVSSSNLIPGEQHMVLPQIPPYGHVTIPVKFQKEPLLTNEEREFTILIAGSSLTESLRVRPILYSWYVLGSGGGILAVFTIIIFIIIRKSRRVSVSQ